MLRKKGIIVRQYFRNPLYQAGYSIYFKDTRNDQEYSYVLGCLGAPALKRRGFGMILAVDRNPTPKLENCGTDNRYIRVLDEIEELDFRPLILGCSSLRDKWIGGKGSREDVLNQVWWSGMINDAHTRALVKINENFISSKKPTLYLANSEIEFREVVDCLYHNMLSLVLGRKIRGYLSNFRAEDAKKRDSETLNPAVSALARGVYYLTAFAPWGNPWWEQNYHDRNPWDEASFLPDSEDPWGQPMSTGNRIATMEEEEDAYDDTGAGRHDGFDEYEQEAVLDDGDTVNTVFD